MSLQINVRRIRFVVTKLTINVADEIRQRIINARKVFARKAAFYIVVGAHAKKNGVEFVQQFLKPLVLTDSCVEHELHAHAFENFTPLSYDLLFKLEWRNSIGKQSANLRIGVVHDGTNSVAGKNISRGKACRTRTNDADALAGIGNIRHVGSPALADGFIGDVALDAPDRNGAIGIFQRAGTFAKSILWTNATANFRQ